MIKFSKFLAMIALMALLTSCIKVTIELPRKKSDNADKKNAEPAITMEEPESIEKEPVYEEPAYEAPAQEINIIPSMSAEERREINIFLSNFSEAYYGTGGYSDADEEKISFAFTHANINLSNLTFYENEFMGIKASDLDSILIRFFGSTVPHKTPSGSTWWIYRDGKFLMPAASGESYSCFTVATKAVERQDGYFNVEFKVYSDPSVIGGDVITDKSVYYLNEAEADARYDYCYNGKAVLKAKVYNGKNTYEVVSYSAK